MRLGAEAAFNSRDCATVGCPNEADTGSTLCRYCRTAVVRREERLVGEGVCKVEGCFNVAPTLGRYAGYCATHRARVERGSSSRDRAKDTIRPKRRALKAVPAPAPDPLLEGAVRVAVPITPEEPVAGPLLGELIDGQPAYELAQEAAAIVKDRMVTYGPPSVNHGCTAELWAAWLNRRFGVRLELTAADVCWLNVLQKLSREANLPSADNRLDVMGFAINAGLSTRA